MNESTAKGVESASRFGLERRWSRAGEGLSRPNSQRGRPDGDPLSRLLLLGQRRLRLARIRTYLQTSLWVIPALTLSLAAVLSLSTTSIDRNVDTSGILPLEIVSDVESARGILSLISSWMLSFIGLAFTMTIVVLQLASGQFSPRVLGTLLRDRYSQYAMGTFIGTFAYAFLVLREVGTGATPEFVPAVSLAVTFGLVLVSLGVFIRYVNHVAQSIRAGSVIFTVADATRSVVDELYPRTPHVPDRGEDWRPYRIIPAPTGGTLKSYDIDSLVALARDAGTVIEIMLRVGDFVPRGAPLVRVAGRTGDVRSADLLPQISIGRERTMQQDPAFGFRQLVDIASRALSPGVNDPTTAVQVIDQLHDLLRDMLHREFPDGFHHDVDGVVRLVVPPASWEAYLALATEEIRHYGADSMQVERRLREMLMDLHSAAPGELRPAIERELGLLDAAVANADVQTG